MSFRMREERICLWNSLRKKATKRKKKKKKEGNEEYLFLLQRCRIFLIIKVYRRRLSEGASTTYRREIELVRPILRLHGFGLSFDRH